MLITLINTIINLLLISIFTYLKSFRHDIRSEQKINLKTTSSIDCTLCQNDINWKTTKKERNHTWNAKHRQNNIENDKRQG